MVNIDPIIILMFESQTPQCSKHCRAVWTEENLFTSTGINIIYAFIIFLKKTTDNIKFFFTPCRVIKASVDSVKVISRMEGGRGIEGVYRN